MENILTFKVKYTLCSFGTPQNHAQLVSTEKMMENINFSIKFFKLCFGPP